jgi:hypothetical protein
MTCDKCGKTLEVGCWPWCPHEPALHFGEDPMRPYYDGELDAHITTRAERRSIMRAKGLEYKDVSKKLRGKVYVDLHR